MPVAVRAGYARPAQQQLFDLHTISGLLNALVIDDLHLNTKDHSALFELDFAPLHNIVRENFGFSMPVVPIGLTSVIPQAWQILPPCLSSNCSIQVSGAGEPPTTSSAMVNPSLIRSFPLLATARS